MERESRRRQSQELEFRISALSEPILAALMDEEVGAFIEDEVPSWLLDFAADRFE